MRGRESIRIAMIVWDLSISGGTQRQAIELAHYLIRTGHSVRLYCAYLNRSKCYPDRLKGLDVRCLHEGDYSKSRDNLKGWILYPPEPLFSKKARELADLIDGPVDLLNPHDFQAYRSAHYFKKKHGTPSVWMVNDLPRSLVIPKLGLGARKRIDFFHYVLFGGPVGFHVDRARIRSMDRAVVFDRPTMEAFRERTGIEPARMGSGLDPSAFEFRPRNGCARKGAVSALAVGIFFPHRRFEDLLRAAKMAVERGCDVRVTLVGTEAYEQNYARKIHSLVSELGLEKRVEFLGEITEEALKRLYADSDVLVFPNYPQTWGLAVFEAMASGTPVIVSTGAGASEILRDEETALLVPPGRPEEIASRLRRLCEDGELYAKLSRGGRKFVEENVSWDAYGKRMEMLFVDAVSASGMGRRSALEQR